MLHDIFLEPSYQKCYIGLVFLYVKYLNNRLNPKQPERLLVDPTLSVRLSVQRSVCLLEVE